MLGLAIHTSSPQLGLMLKSVDPAEASDATDEVNSVARHQVWDLGREVSSQLHTKLIDFIAPYSWQDLCFVAVAKGPGGFTGTRIGVVTARTLAQQLDIPLFGVSTTAALAAEALSNALSDTPLDNPADNNSGNNDSGNNDIAVMMPAKREAVFGAIYRPDGEGDLHSVLADQVMPEATWATTLKGWHEAQGRSLRQIETMPSEGLAESVTGVMTLACVRWAKQARPDWSSVMPFYGQHPVTR
ncbi:MAG: tRNA (adenosine(37)-N6)-threonylcarbamoyltransferase complex dimerization subunit type 1 TsaB [Cyanobacteria bacterium P01_A01_bin.116]